MRQNEKKKTNNNKATEGESTPMEMHNGIVTPSTI